MNNILNKIIPTPSIISVGEEYTMPDIGYIICNDFEEAVDTFRAYADKLGVDEGETGISVLKDKSIPAEGWKMTVCADKVCVYASDACGANHGLAALLQIIYRNDGKAPICQLESSPDCSFRGVMIDLARNWHEYHYLNEFVGMCWLFSIKHLHLHFTDDQSYTLPSKLFPKLSTEDRHYSFEQIEQLVEYAKSCGVSLIPEIDVPGHSTQFAKNYPEIFGDYGIITHTEASMNEMGRLFSELCDMFPYSELIHIGGDEADIIRWTEHEECRAYTESCGIDFNMQDKRLLSERILANFVQKMADAVKAKGKQAVAWEGFGKAVNDYVSKDIIMYSWENFYQTTPELLEAGYKIINGSWNPTYIVTPVVYWKLEDLYDWNIYKWIPVHGGSPYAGRTLEIQPNENVIGGQLLAWGDAIAQHYPNIEDGVAEEQRLVFERAPVMAEKTWNIDVPREKQDFVGDIPNVYEMLCKMVK